MDFTPGTMGFITEPKRRGRAVVSNVQLYLDLINFKGRGEEQAAAIRHNCWATENGGYEPKEVDISFSLLLELMDA